jgi:hypothetical protein
MLASLALMSVLSIASGEPVLECGWPSAVAVSSAALPCSAVLVHPQVVVLHETCTADSAELSIHVGDGEALASHPVDPADCAFADGFGFCVLSQPLALPIAPILTGCELAELQPGAELRLVGYGSTTLDYVDAVKRHAGVEVAFVHASDVFIAGEHAPCPGDVGGPAFLQLADGSWRIVGIAQSGGCDGMSTYRLLSPMIPWIEAESGFDVTPCHDADGVPDPGPACGGFYAGEAGPDGTWDDLCSAAPTGGAGGVCSKDENEDETGEPTTGMATTDGSGGEGSTSEPEATDDTGMDAGQDARGGCNVGGLGGATGPSLLVLAGAWRRRRERARPPFRHRTRA